MDIKEVGPFERLVTMVLPEDKIEETMTVVARRLAREMKFPGFRPGRAPRRVVEAAVGASRLRSDAVEDLLPGAVGEALRDADLEPAASPSLQSTDDVDGGVEIEVRVALWPSLENPPQYRDRRIELPSVAVTEEELGEQLDRLRDQFAELETVERPATAGDYTTINISATQGGQPVPEVAAEGLLYEVGSGAFLEGIDEHLEGSRAGSIVSHDGPLPAGFGERAGEQVTFSVLVKDVQQKKLPELTDEWASEVTEYDTVDELRADLAERLERVKLASAHERYRQVLLDELIAETDVDIPESIVTTEMDELLHSFSHRLAEQEISIDDYLQVAGQDEQAFVNDLRLQAQRNIQTKLILEAVARAEQLEVEDDHYSEVVEFVAHGAELEEGELAQRLAGTAQEKELRGDILRNKALDTLMNAATPVDESGEPIDFGPLEESEEQPDPEEDEE